ncbi:MAG: stage III sporulation protein AC [Clostridia bacterium]|nr:stage III sporulation protein AC [Clostridia bacterium]
MDIELILKVCGVGMIVTVLCGIMAKAGKEEQSSLVSLVGSILILILLAEKIGELVNVLKGVFGI